MNAATSSATALSGLRGMVQGPALGAFSSPSSNKRKETEVPSRKVRPRRCMLITVHVTKEGASLATLPYSRFLLQQHGVELTLTDMLT